MTKNTKKPLGILLCVSVVTRVCGGGDWGFLAAMRLVTMVTVEVRGVGSASPLVTVVTR